MNIVLLLGAVGELINGPVVRVPPGSYSVKKEGDYSNCQCCIGDSPLIDLSSALVLSHHTSVRLIARDAKALTIKLVAN